jgi:hypothetical protein
MFRGIDMAFDDYIEVPNTNNAFNLVSAWTLTAWANPQECQTCNATSPSSGIFPIIWKIAQPFTNEDTFALLWSPKSENKCFGTKLERASDGQDFGICEEKQKLPGQWYCVVGLYDGNSLKIYVNGMLEGTNTIGPVTAYDGPEPLRIGSYENSTHGEFGSFQGKIDEVRIYDRALLDGEIQALCNGGVIDTDGDGVSRPVLLLTPIQMWWHRGIV